MAQTECHRQSPAVGWVSYPPVLVTGMPRGGYGNRALQADTPWVGWKPTPAGRVSYPPVVLGGTAEGGSKERIIMEIIVDANRGEEQAMGVCAI